MQQKSLHWYPGHMQKAMRQIEEKLKLIDVVVEVVDSRIPLSSKNPFLENLTSSKKRLLVFSKKDLVNVEDLKAFEEYYKNKGYLTVVADLNNRNDIALIRKGIDKAGEEKQAKFIKRGMKPQPIRTLILGIPNVGKSTLINKLSKSTKASVANTPGHTRAQQWIKVDKTLELLDTPGILPPHYEDKKYALNLALTGAMKVENLSVSELFESLIKVLLTRAKADFMNRYDLLEEDLINNDSILRAVSKRRGLMLSGGEFDIDRCELLILKEYKEGIITKIVLDELC
jgi:ribosome biogenesis GTPase A